jgi:hypothetical protein
MMGFSLDEFLSNLETTLASNNLSDGEKIQQLAILVQYAHEYAKACGMLEGPDK